MQEIKRPKRTKRKASKGNAIAKPILEQELKRFKAIVRHIAKQEVGGDQGNWFLMDKRANLRRLGPFAVWGNQPATAVHVEMSDDEIQVVTRAILL